MIAPDAGWKLIDSALQEERPLLTTGDLRVRVENKFDCANLWLGERSAVFTAITDYPGYGERVLEVGPAGGDLIEIGDSFARFDDVARATGCTQTHILAGRPGWARVSKRHGFEPFYYVLRKLY